MYAVFKNYVPLETLACGSFNYALSVEHVFDGRAKHRK